VLDGFATQRIDTGEASINLVVGGAGPPLLLLHGYPQTHVCWHRVAPRLAERFTVVCPDLRGYGESRGLAEETPDHAVYSKRAMARDQVALMRALGFERFGVTGHDRGGRVAYRLALDHPERVTRLALLDIIPTGEMVARVDRKLAYGSYHWFFLAQPFDLPERLIGAAPDFYLEWTIGSWLGEGAALAPEAMERYRAAFRNPSVIHAACEDYRAGLGIDAELDAADKAAGRRIACPVLVLWGERRPERKADQWLAIWRQWADRVEGGPVTSGHFLAEERPDEIAARLECFFGASA
jgi:haloacetate dehalogenase